jgi:hypothetical protein
VNNDPPITGNVQVSEYSLQQILERLRREEAALITSKCSRELRRKWLKNALWDMAFERVFTSEEIAEMCAGQGRASREGL